MKIGQEVEFKNDFKIETMISKTVLQVKEGDRAIATNNGLRILTGEARGKITSYIDNRPEGYDHKNIANMILNRLNRVFGIEEFLDYNDINDDEMIMEIEDVLMDIL